MEVMQDHQHGGQDTALVQGTPSLFCPSLQLRWPSECLLASPRETTGRSPKAMSGLLLWFRGDDGGEQGFACGRWGVRRERCSAAMGTRLWGVLWAVLTPRLSPGWVWASMSCAKDHFSSFGGDGQVPVAWQCLTHDSR